LIPAKPAGAPATAQVASWPSSHRLGVMKEKLGVVSTDARSVVICVRGTSLVAQTDEPVMAEK
jgi:hypothetical protein